MLVVSQILLKGSHNINAFVKMNVIELIIIMYISSFVGMEDVLIGQ